MKQFAEVVGDVCMRVSLCLAVCTESVPLVVDGEGNGVRGG